MAQNLENTIDYVEMASRDLAATQEFFRALFGWKFEDYGPDYCAFEDGRIAGGFYASETVASGNSGAPLLVVYRKELEQAHADVRRLSGRISRDIFEFPGGRRFHFEAPGGGEFAIWSDK